MPGPAERSNDGDDDDDDDDDDDGDDDDDDDDDDDTSKGREACAEKSQQTWRISPEGWRGHKRREEE